MTPKRKFISKSMMRGDISTSTGQFAYFDTQLGKPDWRGRSVLDFGGNAGNFLREAGDLVRPEDYWCLDVSHWSLEKGREAFPRAHWIFYDRFNFCFNPSGVRGEPLPDLGRRFDFIIAYSVFTHIDRVEMVSLIAQLRDLLQPDGQLAWTFIDPHLAPWPDSPSLTALGWRLNECKKVRSDLDVDLLLEKARHTRWCTLINDEELYLGDERPGSYTVDEMGTYHVFYSTEYMQELFAEATILSPVHGHMQSCICSRQGDAEVESKPRSAFAE